MKNDERLRKLQATQMGRGRDDISTGDPEDILDRFMSKQKHNRYVCSATLLAAVSQRVGKILGIYVHTTFFLAVMRLTCTKYKINF